MFLVVGFTCLPLTTSIFSNFFDRGYIFSKILGIAIVSYLIFILGIFHILPFNQINSILALGLFLAINLFIGKNNFLKILRGKWKIFILEEFIFLSTLLVWSFVRGHQPDIHGLEKYMDFGFINSILRSDYFPPKDMWFTPLPINYYYFGHLVTAVLTKISDIPSYITFNLMVATIFGLIFTSSFSIGANLLYLANKQKNLKAIVQNLKILIAGFLSAFLVAFAGNLHALYSFFKPYPNENPVPFWQLSFSPNTFPNSYWYPNATRFIYHTIHEFPIYSFVVSDLHGHVLDIPFVLLTIALFLNILMSKYLNIFKIILIGSLLAVMYMTNVWDAVIYLLLTIILIMYLNLKSSTLFSTKYLLHTTYYILLTVGVLFLFSLPFSVHFKPFASGIGILCPPQFLEGSRIGPFLFEASHCQKSPLWQLLILYGFFYFWVIYFVAFIIKKFGAIKNWNRIDIFIVILIIISTILIIIPEFVYVKDIYPAHYRANTMFKLAYQSFVMLSIASGYIISSNIKRFRFNFLIVIIGGLSIFLVFVYPFFAINSYYGTKTYSGLNGLTYLKNLYPDDFEAITFLNKNIKGQPIILEAQGDSYTDYSRVSSNTGLPTVLGWMVHEWLWRGTYDVPAPRISEIQSLYETHDLELTKNLLNKYKISLIFVGDLERQKYQNLYQEKFSKIGSLIYKSGQTNIYKITSEDF